MTLKTYFCNYQRELNPQSVSPYARDEMNQLVMNIDHSTVQYCPDTHQTKNSRPDIRDRLAGAKFSQRFRV